MTADRRTLWLAFLFMLAGVLLLARLFLGQNVQLSPGPVLLTSMPTMEGPK